MLLFIFEVCLRIQYGRILNLVRIIHGEFYSNGGEQDII